MVLQPAGAENVAKAAAAKGRTPEAQSEQEKRLMSKCLEFESILFYCMIKKMRDTIQKGGLTGGGNAEEVYASMLDQEYAKVLSESTRSTLAAAMYEQLQQKEDPNKSSGSNNAADQHATPAHEGMRSSAKDMDDKQI